MLVFVDESGDPGRKTDSGSSKFFVVSTVVFRDRDAALACDHEITALRAKLNLSPSKEFHFNKDSHQIRREFHQTINKFDFFYSAVVLNKDLLTSDGFRFPSSVYKYTVKLAISNIADHIEDAVVVFDRCGGREFTEQLRNYVRKQMRTLNRSQKVQPIKKIKSAKSHGNNLLQMADMVCGAVARSYSEKQGCRIYRNLIRKKENRVQVWPKK